MSEVDGTPRPTTPWFAVGVGAVLGAVGLVVALAVLAPVPVLGGLLLLGATLALGWLLGRRAWGAATTPRTLPDPGAVEATAEAHRAAARERHGTTIAAVAARLVPPGFRLDRPD